MKWSNDALARNRGRRRRRSGKSPISSGSSSSSSRRRGGSWSKPSANKRPERSSDRSDEKTKLKKPGRGLPHISSTNNWRTFKPQRGTPNNNGWSKPSASQQSSTKSGNNKDVRKKKTKKTPESSGKPRSAVKAKAMSSARERSKQIKMKRGK